ncbi:hypothetical protein [Maritimibacter sp. 55A14]|uniref:hypothetical protein n=1 Tax=Maritimibacter sp. 55A14 TaxID=2174844 RepID=UPI0011B24D39|nr:hypothetical protein [Maritimibacter sp. 55A14]
MRAHQLCQIAQSQLDGRYEFGLLAMPSGLVPGLQRAWVAQQPPGGVYFVTKFCTRDLSPENALRLQRKAAGVCFDHVDRDLSTIATAGADIHICTSHAQKAALEAIQAERPMIGGKAMLLLHNPDARLYGMAFGGPDSFRAVYCGHRKVTCLSEAILKEVTFLEADTTRKMARQIVRLPEFNFHYGVRREDVPDSKVIKPFTKGFNAALCKSNIIVNRQAPDAVEFLGPDYPYLIEGSGEVEILETLARAKDDFGGPEWRRGLQVMASVAERVSAPALAAQIEDILAELGVKAQ